MLSLPLIPPQPDVLRTHFRPRADSPPRQTDQQNLPPHRQQHHQQQSRNEQSKAKPDPRHPLALLNAEEAAISQRKHAIRNFGSYWIRPPGIAKTLQAMNEEAAEMAEQEEVLRQEQGLRDLQARQQLQETREHDEGDAGAGEEGEERDLDDEIPDADAMGMGMAGGADGDVTFNEESIVEGSRENLEVNLEEAELTGAARDEEDLGVIMSAERVEVERDLDDSVPEAGSYQHTDTEVEDSSSGDEDVSFAAQSAVRPTNGGLQERLRQQERLTRSQGSLNLSSSLLESSFVGSSPVAQRGRGQGRRGRMS